MKNIILLAPVFFLLACKNKQNIISLNNNTETIKAINLNELNDSLLIKHFISVKNIEIFNEEEDTTYHKYYDGTVFYPKDSSFKVVNLFGECCGGATYNSISDNYIIKNNKILFTEISGEIFRIDKVNTDNYTLFYKKWSRDGNNITELNALIKNDSLYTTKLTNYCDYYFDIIYNKKNTIELTNKLDLSTWNDENTLTVLGLSNELENDVYYKIIDEPFLLNPFSYINFTIYYQHKYGDELTKILRVNRNDKMFDIVLAKIGGDSFTEKTTTEFVNDSVFIETYTFKEGDSYINPDNEEEYIEEYSHDSIVTKYHYDKLFNFKVIEKDTFSFETKTSYVDNHKIKVVTTYLGKPFTVNNTVYYWRFYNSYGFDSDNNYKKNSLATVSMQLRDINHTVTALTTEEDLSSTYGMEVPDNRLENFKDLNFDGYSDFFLYNSYKSGSGGAFFDAYIFNPKTKIFEYSEELSGGELTVDTLNKTLSTYWKSGIGWNKQIIHYFNDKGQIKYSENIKREVKNKEDNETRILITNYKKIMNNKVVKQKSDTTLFEGY